MERFASTNSAVGISTKINQLPKQLANAERVEYADADVLHILSRTVVEDQIVS